MIILSFSSFFLSFKWFSFVYGWELEFFFSKWTLLFFFVVLFISLIVIFFSFSYIRVYPIKKFLILYVLFVFRIGWLIIVSNFYWIILGWDGLGVVSFLLICYYQNYESNSNALFTLFQNRIGDFFFIVFLVLILSGGHYQHNYLPIARIFLILGARVKRAQYPFNSWLLAAIRAPTPISSLVHSSTLVVAGVYILLQYSYCLLEYIPLVFILSMITLVYRLFGLLYETDIKKLIAYSTIRHVGLIILFFSQILFKITYFHLVVHAIFKSIIFMCFGFCILVSYHAQDFRLVSYRGFYPWVKFFYYYACVCIIGIPFLSAFFSKDYMLEKLIEFSGKSLIMVVLLLLFLGVRVFYRLRLLLLHRNLYVIRFQNSITFGGVRLRGIVLLRIWVMNLFVSLLFRITLEYLMIKIFIYYMIIMFVIVFLLLKRFKKWFRFEKFIWFKEIFFLHFNFLDIYVYRIINDFVRHTSQLFRVKLIVLANWWVIFLVLFFF